MASALDEGGHRLYVVAGDRQHASASLRGHKASHDESAVRKHTPHIRPGHLTHSVIRLRIGLQWTASPISLESRYPKKASGMSAFREFVLRCVSATSERW